MSSYSIVKTFEFDAAHRLMQHQGNCRNIHGHRYKVEFELCSTNLNDAGMIMDFSTLKAVYAEVIDRFDHAILLNEDDHKLIGFCKENVYKWCGFQGDPTVENIAKMLFDAFTKVKKLTFEEDKISVKKVTVWETETCGASFTL